MRNTSVHIVANSILVCCQGAAFSQSQWTDQEILGEVDRFPEARLSTIDTLTPEQRLQILADHRLGFRFERDLNGDGVIDFVAMGTWLQAGGWPHTFLVIADGAGRGDAIYSFNAPFIVGVQHSDGLGFSLSLNSDCGGRIEWNGENFTLVGYTPGCAGPQ
jgi:hypothetical protein